MVYTCMLVYRCMYMYTYVYICMSVFDGMKYNIYTCYLNYFGIYLNRDTTVIWSFFAERHQPNSELHHRRGSLIPRLFPLLHGERCCITANKRYWTNAGLMLAHRRRRWANIKPALDLRLVLTGMSKKYLRYYLITALQDQKQYSRNCLVSR